MSRTDNMEKKLVEVLKAEPGLDIFGIASKMGINPWDVQQLVDKMQEKHMLNSGLHKREGTTIFERLYFNSVV